MGRGFAGLMLNKKLSMLVCAPETPLIDALLLDVIHNSKLLVSTGDVHLGQDQIALKDLDVGVVQQGSDDVHVRTHVG